MRYIPVFLFILLACDDLITYERASLSASVILNDTIMATEAIAAGALVYVSESETDSATYLISTAADEFGIATFDFLPKGHDKLFLFSRVEKDDRLYHSPIRSIADINNEAKAGKHKTASLTLYPIYKPGVKMAVVDESAQAVPYARVYVYNNGSAFLARDTTKSIYKQRANANGIAFFEDTPIGTYYLRATSSFSGRPLVAEDTLQFSTKTFSQTKLIARQRSFKINIQVVDASNHPLANVPVCVYTSQVLANTKQCSNSSLSLQTDLFGKAAFENPAIGKYFFLVNQTINDIPFVGLCELDYKQLKDTDITIVAQ